MAKPGDVFVGVVDFFAIFLPGALLTFIGLNIANGYIFVPPLPVLTDPVSRWAAFLFASYVMGHLIFLLSAWTLDPLYDRTYAKYQRAKKQEQDKLSLDKRIRLFWKCITSPMGDDPLLKYAKQIKSESFSDISRRTRTDQQHIANTLEWATNMVRLQNPVVASEIDHVEADSKFFRSFSTALLLVLVYLFIEVYLVQPPPHGYLLVGCLVLSVLSFLRYMGLRWKRTALTYEYFIALDKLSKPVVKEELD